MITTRHRKILQSPEAAFEREVQLSIKSVKLHVGTINRIYGAVEAKIRKPQASFFLSIFFFFFELFSLMRGLPNIRLK